MRAAPTRLTAIIVVYGAISGLVGWLIVSLIDEFTGGRNPLRFLGMVFIYLPLAWMSKYVLLSAWHRSHVGSILRDWRTMAAAIVSLPVLVIGSAPTILLFFEY